MRGGSINSSHSGSGEGRSRMKQLLMTETKKDFVGHNKQTTEVLRVGHIIYPENSEED